MNFKKSVYFKSTSRNKYVHTPHRVIVKIVFFYFVFNSLVNSGYWSL